MCSLNTRLFGAALAALFVLAGCGEDADSGPRSLGEPGVLQPMGDEASTGAQTPGTPTAPSTPADPDGNDEPQTPSEQGDDVEMMTPAMPMGQTPPADQQEEGLSCRGIIGCFNECAEGERACLDACFNEGTSSGQAALQDLSNCYQENNCNDQSCADEHCLWEQRVCEADGDDSVAPSEPNEMGANPEQAPVGEGELNCNQIFECYAECNRGDQACIQSCADRGYASSRRAVDGIGACIRANQCADNDCVTDNCGAQIRICDADEGRLDLAQPNGRDLTCSEIDACFDQCAANEQACTDRCYNSGSAQAREALSGIGACIRRNDCQDQACVDRECGGAIQACTDDAPVVAEPAEPAEPGGDDDVLACSGIVECFGGCNNDRDCMNACFQSGSPAGQQGLQALSECLQQHQCQNDECMMTNCGDQHLACYGDEAGAVEPADPEVGEGDGELAALDCVGVYQCSNGCPLGDDECRRDCYERGSDQGQAEVDAVSECVRDAQCGDDNCARAACGVEIEACETPDGPVENDPEPGEGPDEGNDPVGEEANAVPEEGNDAPAEGNELPDGDNEEPPAADQPAEEGAAPEAHDNEEPPAEAAPAEEPQADGTCAAPYEADLGQHAGSTDGAQSVDRGRCGGGGREQVFVLRVDADTQVCADTRGSDFDTVLYVRSRACGANGDEIQCNDDFDGVQSQVAFMARAGTEYFVTVDSYNGSGEYSLNLRSGGCN